MSESFVRAVGRKVISRASAQDLGTVGYVLVDAGRPAIVGLVVGKGKKGRLVDWDQVSGFGPDAVMVADEAALRAPATDEEGLAINGKLALVGKRVLTDAGNELGILDDVTFDPGTGALEALRVDDQEIDAGALLGRGSYAVVVRAGLAG